MLAGPAVIGWLTHLTALNHAFLLLTLMCAATAGILRGPRTTPDPPDMSTIPNSPSVTRN